MFVVSQPWQKDSDYKKLVQGLQPPPPPSNDGAWELQFCKWWGWNWVKKKEMEQDPAKKPVDKKPEKKPIKNLCQTLCFKKKKEQKPLQKMYNTPSNSEMEDFKRKMSLQNSYNTALGSTVDPAKKKLHGASSNTLGSEVIGTEVSEQITIEKKKKKRRETSSSDECCCCCCCSKIKTTGSDDSIEFINITCCPCCHSKQPAVSPTNGTEKFTESSPCQCKMMATQTEQQKRRKRRIIVCCCRCGKCAPPRCCTCNGTKCGRKDEGGYLDKYIKLDSSPKATANKETMNVYRAAINQPSKDTCNQFKWKRDPLHISGMPVDARLYLDKPLSKFGTPSRSYSWIHAAKSDIWDEFSHSKLNRDFVSSVSKKYVARSNEKANFWDNFVDVRENDTFSSPLSGKTYSISPIKIDNLIPGSSGLYDPLNIDAELASLKKIESDVKMDLKSRIMLDAVCDAILNKEPEANSSIFLNEFTYPSTVAAAENSSKDVFKSVPEFTEFNETNLKTIFEKPMDKTVHDDRNTKINMILNNLDEHNSRVPPSMQNFRRIFNNPWKESPEPFRVVDYTTKSNQLFMSMREPPLCSKSLLTSKRCASPTQNRDVKKVKLQEPPTLTSLTNANISDIFRKIDEIVTRSKVNNSEIQNVIHNIPKNNFQFFTTWDVSNTTNSDSPSPPPREEIPSDVNIATVVEMQVAKNDDTKNNQGAVKKKSIGSRVSLIPKRCTNSKAFRRNVN